MKHKKFTLNEEIARFKSINSYNMISEQEALPDETLPDETLPAETPPAEGGEMPMDGAETLPDETLPAEGGEMPMGDMEDTEEIDITDLVNMTKSIRNDLDDMKKVETDKTTENNNIFTKLDDFERSFNKIDMLLSRIDALDKKVETMKEPTPVERLEMRSLDSYPFNEKPNEFFDRKQDEMRRSGKNEYILTKEKIENYSPNDVAQSFNADETQINNRY